MFEVIDNDAERIFLVRNEDLPFMNILEERVIEFVKKDERIVVIDFRHLLNFDSVALAALIRIKRKLASMDRVLRLVNYNQTVLRVIELSGLDNFLLE